MLTIITILRTIFVILPNYAGNQPLYSDDDADCHTTIFLVFQTITTARNAKTCGFLISYLQATTIGSVYK